MFTNIVITSKSITPKMGLTFLINIKFDAYQYVHYSKNKLGISQGNQEAF